MPLATTPTGRPSGSFASWMTNTPGLPLAASRTGPTRIGPGSASASVAALGAHRVAVQVEPDHRQRGRGGRPHEANGEVLLAWSSGRQATLPVRIGDRPTCLRLPRRSVIERDELRERERCERVVLDDLVGERTELGLAHVAVDRQRAQPVERRQGRFETHAETNRHGVGGRQVPFTPCLVGPDRDQHRREHAHAQEHGQEQRREAQPRTAPHGAENVTDHSEGTCRTRGISRTSNAPTERGGSGVAGVEALQQVVGGQFDRLVPPLGGPVHAGDEAGAVHPPEVAVDERVARLRLVVGPVGEAEVPRRVLVPRVGLEERVLRVGGRAARRPSRCRGRTGGPR